MYETLKLPPPPPNPRHTPHSYYMNAKNVILVVRGKNSPQYFTFGHVSEIQTTGELYKTLNQKLSSSHLAMPLHAGLLFEAVSLCFCH